VRASPVWSPGGIEPAVNALFELLPRLRKWELGPIRDDWWVALANLVSAALKIGHIQTLTGTVISD
jgi:hypothetical protein